jgi:hypothetical protein
MKQVIGYPQPTTDNRQPPTPNPQPTTCLPAMNNKHYFRLFSMNENDRSAA